MFMKTIEAYNQRLGAWVAAQTPEWVTPNGVSWSRVAAGVMMLAALPVHSLLLQGLYFYACLSDWWDGQLARYRKQDEDPRGRRLDERADKWLMLLTLPVFVGSGVAPVGGHVFWAIVLILARDAVVTCLRWLELDWAKDQRPLPIAKLKTGLLMVGSFLLLLGWEVAVHSGGFLIMLSAFSALISGWQYCSSLIRWRIKARRDREARSW